MECVFLLQIDSAPFLVFLLMRWSGSDCFGVDRFPSLFLCMQVWYKDRLMIEVEPYERCFIKIGILIENCVHFFKFAPPCPEVSLGEFSSADNYFFD